MTEKTKLNKFQRDNVSLLTPIALQLLKSGDWTRTPAPLMRCVSCGGRVSTPIMSFFGWDGTRFKCYDCQKKERENLN